MKIPKPLDDIRILSIESYGAGPWGTMQLADLGAEVIKIETPGVGDVARHVPPGAIDNDSLFFQSVNRGKKSIQLDIRTPDGRNAFNRLLPAVDVLFANPRGDMPEKMSITYDDLKEFNPRIVCCFLTGFGRTGPRRNHPGYDYLAQALSGMVWLGGEPGSPPARCGVSVIDMAAGTNAAMLILAGVHQARKTGLGCTIDTSLLEVAVSYGNYLNTWYLTAGVEPKKLPLGAHQSIVPSQLFATADGWLMVMAQQDKFYRLLVLGMGMPQLGNDERFLTVQDRYENRDQLVDILSKAFKKKTTAAWLELLEGKVPVAPVNSIPEALKDPQVEALGLIVEYDHSVLGRIKQTGPPFSVSEYQPEFKPASALGSDTETVLREYAKLSPKEVSVLYKTPTA